MYKYLTSGVCAKNIEFEVDNNVVKNITFYGGCNGNLQGISKLAEGMEINKIIEKLSGIKCGNKPTSCPDQLAKALMEYKINKTSDKGTQSKVF